MFLLLYFIFRSVAACRTVIVAMRCVIVSINHYLSTEPRVYACDNRTKLHKYLTRPLAASVLLRRPTTLSNKWRALSVVKDHILPKWLCLAVRNIKLSTSALNSHVDTAYYATWWIHKHDIDSD